MKKNQFIVGSGVLALGLVFTCGCSTVVMDERDYTPAEEIPTAEAPAQMTAETENTVSETPAPAAKQEVPTFTPMEGNWNNEGISSPAPAAKKAPRKVKKAANGVHVVQSGDTLGAIAYTYGVSLSSVMKANNFDKQSASRIRPGQKILIPGKDGKVNASATAKAPARKAAAAPAAGMLNADGTYTIKSGDNIPKIARKLGIKARDLQNANNLSDEATRRLQIGQKLIVPGKSSAAPAAATPEAETPVAPAPAQQDELQVLIDAANSTSTTPAAATETPETVTVPASEAVTVPAGETVTVPAGEVSAEETIFIEVPADTTIDEFAVANKTTAAKLRKLNPDVAKDGKLKAGELLFVPVVK